MASPQPVVDTNTLNYRYSALSQLWMHHNTCQLQWPVVIIGVVLVGLSTLSASLMPLLTVPRNWGTVPAVMTLGICFLFAGIAVALMCHTMSRARIIMRRTEEQLRLIEDQLGIRPPLMDFGALNHPPGVSGPLLLRCFLAIGVCVPINVLGFLFALGPTLGSAASILVVVWASFELRNIRVSHASR